MATDHLSSEPGQPDPSSALLTNDERIWGMLAHLSSLVGFLVPFGNVLAPLVVWLVKKDASTFVDFHGKESINFQINMIGYVAIAVALTAATCGFGAVVLVPLAILLPLYTLIMAIVAGIKAHEGQRYLYPFIIRLL